MARRHALISTFAVLSISVLAAGSALAASADATASVTVLAPLSVTNTGNMNFGDILPPSDAAQDFDLSASAGTISTSGTGKSLGGTVSRAVFSVDGEAGQNISVSTSVTDFSVSDPVSLAVEDLTDLDGDTGSIPGGGGPGTINVGGTLTVDQDAAAGSYSGALITLMVDYM